MKRILLSLVILVALRVPAQTLPQVRKIPEQKVPGNHQIKLPTNPDLTIINFRLLSITKDDNTGTYKLRISYTIKNTGERSTAETAPGSRFDVMCYINRGVVMPMYLPHNGLIKTDAYDGNWGFAEEAFRVNQPIEGNSFINVENEFSMTYSTGNNGEKFYLVMGADLWNATKETNRRNNYSNIILVTPPR